MQSEIEYRIADVRLAFMSNSDPTMPILTTNCCAKLRNLGLNVPDGSAFDTDEKELLFYNENSKNFVQSGEYADDF